MSYSVIKVAVNKSKNGNFKSSSKETCQQKEPRLRALKQLKIALCLTIGNLTTGYTAGWAVPIIPKLKDPLKTHLPYLILDTDASLIMRLMSVGAIIGCIISGFTANKVGRKPTLLYASSFNVLGYVLMASAGNVATLLLGRMFAGVAAGAFSMLHVVYLGEIASPELRGSLIAMAGIMHVFGTVLVYSLGPYVRIAAVCYVCVGIGCVHALVLGSTRGFQSALCDISKHNEARLTLHDLGRTEDIDEEPKLIGKDSNEALLAGTNDHANVPKRRIERKNIRGFFITTVLLIMQAAGGRIIAMFYAIGIFKNTFSTVDPNVGVVVLGLTELCGVFLTPLLVERCGRRIMLLMSFGFCCFFMVMLGTYFYIETVEVNHHKMIIAIKWLPIVFLMLFLFTFNFGLGIVPNILSSELFSSSIRTTGCSIAMMFSWFVLLCINFNYKDIATEYNYGVFWISAGINAMGFFFVIFVVPETSGKSFLEIGHLLERRNIF